MKSAPLFFKKLSVDKIVLLSLSPIFATISSMKNTLIALSIIVMLDAVTGVRKSLFQKGIKFNPLKKDFWMTIESSGLRQSWRKTYEYSLGIIAFAVLDSLILGDAKFTLIGKEFGVAELAATLACFIEIYSIYENMEAVSGKNLFKSTLSFLPRKVSEALDPDTQRRSGIRRRRDYDEDEDIIDELINDVADEDGDN